MLSRVHMEEKNVGDLKAGFTIRYMLAGKRQLVQF